MLVRKTCKTTERRYIASLLAFLVVILFICFSVCFLDLYQSLDLLRNWDIKAIFMIVQYASNLSWCITRGYQRSLCYLDHLQDSILEFNIVCAEIKILAIWKEATWQKETTTNRGVGRPFTESQGKVLDAFSLLYTLHNIHTFRIFVWPWPAIPAEIFL